MALKRLSSSMTRSFRLFCPGHSESQGRRMLPRPIPVKRTNSDPRKILCLRRIPQDINQRLDHGFSLSQAEPASYWVEQEQRNCTIARNGTVAISKLANHPKQSFSKDIEQVANKEGVP